MEQKDLCIDLAHLRGFTLGDETLEQDLLSLFEDNVELYLKALADSIPAEDDSFSRAAHRLKGVARGLGAVKMANLAEDMETMEKKHKREKAFQDLQAEAMKAKAVLRKIILGI